VEPYSGASPGLAWGEEEGLDRRALPISVREGRREGAHAGLVDRGAAVGPRAGEEGEKGRRKEAIWVGPCGEGRVEEDAVGRAARGEKGEKKKKGRWAGPREK
jgi:hypothetical protein